MSCDSYLSEVDEVPTSHKGGQFSWSYRRLRLVSPQSMSSACASSVSLQVSWIVRWLALPPPS